MIGVDMSKAERRMADVLDTITHALSGQKPPASFWSDPHHLLERRLRAAFWEIFGNWWMDSEMVHNAAADVAEVIEALDHPTEQDLECIIKGAFHSAALLTYLVEAKYKALLPHRQNIWLEVHPHQYSSTFADLPLEKEVYIPVGAVPGQGNLPGQGMDWDSFLSKQADAFMRAASSLLLSPLRSNSTIPPEFRAEGLYPDPYWLELPGISVPDTEYGYAHSKKASTDGHIYFPTPTKEA